MRASALVASPGGRMRLEEVEVGPPGPGEVLVRLAASGVCHTDADMVSTTGDDFIPGHEGAGTVLDLGPGVEGPPPGSRVLLTWAIACGQCAYCRRGLKVLCSRLGAGPGGHAHPEATTLKGVPLRRGFNLGTMSTHAVVRREAVVPLREGVELDVAALLGCAVMTGWGSVVKAGRVAHGESVAVLGCGGVGLNVIQAAALAGAGIVIAIDVEAARLDAAKRLGATHAITATPGETDLGPVARGVHELTEGLGADVAFECTAVPQLAAEVLRLARHGGRVVAVSGVEQEVKVDMRLFEWDKSYVNPLYGDCDPDRDFDVLQDLYLGGRLRLRELIGGTYALHEFEGAFDDLQARRPGRGLLLMP